MTDNPRGITDALVDLFKQDEAQYGTKVALWNVVFLFLSRPLHDLGVQTLKAEPKDVE